MEQNKISRRNFLRAVSYTHLAPRLEDIEHQRLIDIGLAAGIHAAKLAVAADGTIARCV